MAGSSLLTLLDDIATLLDDVGTLTQMATKKTAGVLGDDLAVNAEKVTGVKVNRELPVVWAVAKGSLKNKCLLVPSALLISVFIPWLIVPLLVVGGVFLCFEGFEKIWHYFFHKAERIQHRQALVSAVKDESTDIITFEQEKIKGAIRTDLILSAEIIVITLGVVSQESFMTQVIVLSVIALLVTIGVYGLVAGIVKLDDAGLYLSRKTNVLQKNLGRLMVRLAPWLMRGLSFFGTLAMFLVGGGIISHNVEMIHHLSETFTHFMVGFSILTSLLFDLLLGLFIGFLSLCLVNVYLKLKIAVKKVL